MTAELTAKEFTAFFHAVHGYDPFPWQGNLAQKVFAEGWQKALDVPTGAGKTAAIDIAVFHLALEADRGVARQAPVRILFVVDRRLIVDEAYIRANKIADALAGAGDGVLMRVANRLGLLAEDPREPLVVTRLRGGVPKDPDWLRTPAQPTIVLSTVDQVGSRMLFRGYGVSDTMKSVHAGLLGVDALLLLDEAHLSQPFVQTARDARMFQDKGAWSADAAHAPFVAVMLSATQTEKAEPLVVDDDYAHPILGPRLKRNKPAELIKSDAMMDDAAFAEEFAKRAWALSKTGGGNAQVVAVVVNRVKRARNIFETLKERGAQPFDPTAFLKGTAARVDSDEEAPADLCLLIGRTRELDRMEILRDLLPRIKAGRNYQQSDRSLFVVATQCVEAGADLDFDALVTEIAPLDCLRQRFGRLNRMGRDIEASAVILAANDQVINRAKPDPIYGEALKTTWNLLEGICAVSGKGKRTNRPVDFGIKASETWLPDRAELSIYLAPKAEAPVLLPRELALWSRTSPVPAVDPEVSLYLHGPQSGPGDVGIVWRADLDEEAAEEEWIDRVGVCPPSALETLSIPIGEAKRWLCGRADGDILDVEVGYEDDETRIERRDYRALRWRGTDDARTGIARADDLGPGDVIVVPSHRGGRDAWGWAPESRKPVPDLGREANREHRALDILRLSHASLELGLEQEGESALADQLADMIDTQIVDEFSKYLVTAKESADFCSAGRARVLRGRDGHPLALQQRIRRLEVSKKAGFPGGEAVTEDDDSPGATERPVHLDRHCQGVRDYARRFASQIGFVPSLVTDIALAGYLHDGGKAHPAFKRLLYGGAELAAIGGPPLAKSTKLPGGRRARIEARRRAGFPKNARHEVASIAFAEMHPTFSQANDPELVLWLIGTHHGYGRPLFPAVDWPPMGGEAIEANLGDGMFVVKPTRSLSVLTVRWVELFDRLQTRYGPWGLARLEAILRLADHRQSEAEQMEIEQTETVS